MIKKILNICCIIIFTISTVGCSAKNITNKPVNEVQQNKNQGNSSEAGGNKTIQKGSDDLKDYLTQKDKILLAGKINNNLDIHMELQAANKDHFDDIGDLYYNSSTTMAGGDVAARYEGVYYYDKYMKNIRIEAKSYSNGYFNIFEFDEKNNFNGSFGGFIYQGKLLKGMWSNKDGKPKYQFYLTKNGTEIGGLDLNLDNNRIGDYLRNGSNANNSTVLTINTVSDEKFKFHISGYSKPNIGNVGGVAEYTDNSKNKAEFYDKGSNLKIIFDFEGKTIKVSGNDILSQYGGAHVTLEGTFQKSDNRDILQ